MVPDWWEEVWERKIRLKEKKRLGRPISSALEERKKGARKNILTHNRGARRERREKGRNPVQEGGSPYRLKKGGEITA